MNDARTTARHSPLPPVFWTGLAVAVVAALGYSGTWACGVSRDLGKVEGQAEAILKADRALRELNAADRIDRLELRVAELEGREGADDQR